MTTPTMKDDPQKDCRTIERTLDRIRETFDDPAWRIERFEVHGVFPNGAKRRIKFDRANIGQVTRLKQKTKDVGH
jgi:hypothetical protein